MRLTAFDYYLHFPVAFLSDDQQRTILPVPLTTIKLPMFLWALDAAGGLTNFPNRPSTHQLLVAIIQLVGGQVKGVLIDRLSNGLYLSKIIIERLGRVCECSCEASDAIIIAIILDQPILVADFVIDRYAFRLDAHGQPVSPISSDDLDRLQKLVED